VKIFTAPCTIGLKKYKNKIKLKIKKIFTAPCTHFIFSPAPFLQVQDWWRGGVVTNLLTSASSLAALVAWVQCVVLATGL